LEPQVPAHVRRRETTGEVARDEVVADVAELDLPGAAIHRRVVGHVRDAGGPVDGLEGQVATDLAQLDAAAASDLGVARDVGPADHPVHGADSQIAGDVAQDYVSAHGLDLVVPGRLGLHSAVQVIHVHVAVGVTDSDV